MQPGNLGSMQTLYELPLAPPANDRAYRRLRYVTIVAPTVFVGLMLGLVVLLAQEVSPIGAFVVGAVIVAALVPVFSWAVFDTLDSMRSRLIEQQDELRLTGEQLQQHAREVALLRDRNIAGSDSNDEAIQAIYGVGLKLEACLSRFDADPGQVQAELDLAIGTLNDIIENLRASLMDLRASEDVGSAPASATRS
jgi:signal transduction histidine kinase